VADIFSSLGEGVTKTTILTPKQLNLISMDSFGSIVDLPCIFQSTCTVTEPIQFGVEAVLVIETTQVLPIDLNIKLPDLSFDVARSINYHKDKDDDPSFATWKLMGQLVLDGGIYELSEKQLGGGSTGIFVYISFYIQFLTFFRSFVLSFFLLFLK
jgi:hypothetical protein